MSLNSIPAIVLYERIVPRILERDRQSLACVCKQMYEFSAREAYFHLGMQSKPNPIKAETLYALRFLATHAPNDKCSEAQKSCIKTKEAFEECVAALDTFQPQNAVHLRNRLRCFWHLNYSFSDEIKTAVKHYKDAVRESFVEIGRFSVAYQKSVVDYRVVAHAPLQWEGVQDDVLSKHSGLKNVTAIHFLGGDDTIKYGAFSSPHILVYNGVRGTNNVWTTERHLARPRVLDLRQQRIEMECYYYLDYSNGLCVELEIKIIQVMIEILQQNASKPQIKINSYESDYSLYAMAGFTKTDEEITLRMQEVPETTEDTAYRDEIIQQQMDYRNTQEGKLFRFTSDYSKITAVFNRSQLNEKNVRLSREQGLVPESWSEIISRQPILYPEAGINPYYRTDLENPVLSNNQ